MTDIVELNLMKAVVAYKVDELIKRIYDKKVKELAIKLFDTFVDNSSDMNIGEVYASVSVFLASVLSAVHNRCVKEESDEDFCISVDVADAMAIANLAIQLLSNYADKKGRGGSRDHDATMRI